jgi:hypothetical protein
MKNKRVPAEQTFEEMITTSSISEQHNPWHGGALNGNDIERLLESVEWVFSTLKLIRSTDEKLLKELSEIEEVELLCKYCSPPSFNKIAGNYGARRSDYLYRRVWRVVLKKHHEKSNSQDALYFFPCRSVFEEIWHCWFAC